MQEEQSTANKNAWSYRAYEHWLRYSGPPHEAAAGMVADPTAYLRHDLPYLGRIEGKRIINMMGSNARKAVPLALLGADVTVVDISPAGARYAEELARAAGVQINYRIADVMEVQDVSYFDLAFMEGGIFHYITDLSRFMTIIYNILNPGGRLLARDFHPYRKCDVLPDGYFDAQLHDGEVAYQQFFPEEEQPAFPKCRLRYWTLGEIVSATVQAGLSIDHLIEFPHRDSPNIPGEFLITATKPA